VSKEEKIEKLYLDQEGYDLYLQEIEDMKEKLVEHQKSKGDAYTSSAGDGWHDNFAFEDNVRVERMLLGQLREKMEKLKDIVIIERKTSNDSAIDINDVVKLTLIFSEDDVETGIYKLVASPTPQNDAEYICITVNSPLGSTIYGKHVGETSSYTVRGNAIGVKIEEKMVMEKNGNQQKIR